MDRKQKESVPQPQPVDGRQKVPPTPTPSQPARNSNPDDYTQPYHDMN